MQAQFFVQQSLKLLSRAVFHALTNKRKLAVQIVPLLLAQGHITVGQQQIRQNLEHKLDFIAIDFLAQVLLDKMHLLVEKNL